MRVLPLVLLLAACSLVPDPGDRIDRFLISPATTADFKRVGAVKKSPLLIETPGVYAPLDNTRIALKPTPSTIDYIADVEWADRLSTLIHESLIQSAQNSGFFEAVGRMNSGLQSKHLLVVDVRKFDKSCADGVVEIEYFAQVMDTQERRILASKSFVLTGDLKENTATDVAQALNQINKQSLVQVMEWLVSVI